MLQPVGLDQARRIALREGFAGELVVPGDGGYDVSRAVHNGLVDKHPALIARCRSATDVATAIRLARDLELEVSVRGGGHSVSGRAVTDGGVMIDLALLRDVTVDPEASVATAAGGVTWGEFNTATHAHRLATTGGVVSTTGIAGLTLGGGLGYLMAKYGLSADNLTAADVVTADGSHLRASAASEPDLFWALRGGGGNFGVVTSLEYRLHPVAEVTAGLVAHPFPAAGEMLRFWREYTADLSDELVTFAGLVHAPDGSGVPLAAMVVCHCGTAEHAQAELAPLLAYGSPAMVAVDRMPYPGANRMLDAGFPRGARNYWKSSFMQDLDDDLIDVMIERFARAPSAMTAMIYEHLHGQVTRVPVSDAAFPHREPGYNLIMTSVWTDVATDDQNITWTRDTFAAMQPHFAARRYANYLDTDDTGEIVRSAYGPNHARLSDIKRRYDPDNVFHLNPNIEPA